LGAAVDFFKTRLFLRLWRAQLLIDCKILLASSR